VWARRAGNVALVKLVRRTIRGERYELPLEVIFGNTSRLLDDPEIYVQKSVGWLLKVTAVKPGWLPAGGGEAGQDLAGG
jgi:3-methyladenine DNA glycosylase AlkD